MATPKKAPTKRAAPAAKATPAAVSEPVPAAPAEDPRLAEIEALRAQLEALRNPPPPPEEDPIDAELRALREELEAARPAEPEPEPMDPKDRVIAELRAQLNEIRSTPEGAQAEMAKALAALKEQVEKMQSGQGKVPVPVNLTPDPYVLGAVLATGEVIFAQHPHATEHLSPDYSINVPVMSYFTLDEDTRAKVAALDETARELGQRSLLAVA